MQMSLWLLPLFMSAAPVQAQQYGDPQICWQDTPAQSSGGAMNRLRVRAVCLQHLPDDVSIVFDESDAGLIEEVRVWKRKYWDSGMLPPDVFYYGLGVANDTNREKVVLLNDVAGEFLLSPYVSILRDFRVKLPPCSIAHVGFWSPFRPILINVDVYAGQERRGRWESRGVMRAPVPIPIGKIFYPDEVKIEGMKALEAETEGCKANIR